MKALWVNARFHRRRMTGVERYASEVTRRMGDRAHLIYPPRWLRGPAGHVWEQVALPRGVKRDRLLWSPANTGPLGVENQVVTIHDLGTIDHPEWYAPGFAAWYAYLLPRLVHHVRRVITVSEFSRRRIIERFHLHSEKVVSIPAGVDLEKFKPIQAEVIDRMREKYRLPCNYILTVGSISPRKNLVQLIEAWKLVQPALDEVQLVLVGGYASAFRNAGLDVHFPGIKVMGYVPDSDLPAIYNGATCMVIPSLYEGFCLPALEAMACGTPLVAANTTALPETLGEAGWLVDPHEKESIAAAILRLVMDDGLRSVLAERGLDRAAQFSFDTTARRVWDVLLECA